MQVAVIANDEQYTNLFTPATTAGQISVERFSSPGNISTRPDIIFYLLAEETLEDAISALALSGCLVVVNAVNTCLGQLPPKFVRINGWPGFVQRRPLELALADADAAAVEQAFGCLGLAYVRTPDVPGFIAARIIAMIVNEAAFAAAEGVSSPAQIDTAMKLGTNYPYGPFEWAQKIGKAPLLTLLRRLEQKNIRFSPASFLENYYF